MATNHIPLTPLRMVERTARIFPRRIAIVHGDLRRSYGEFYERVCRMANGLKAMGVKPDTKVAVLSPNVPMPLEAHVGIPLCGAVIVSINTRLNGKEIAYIVDHSQSEILMVDRGLLGSIKPVVEEMKGLRRIIVAEDPGAGEDDGWRPEGALDYEDFLAGGSPQHVPIPVEDENDVISINYTSGTTGKPKGVMYTHRGTFMITVSNVVDYGLNQDSKYLWVVPNFHCNGWCFTWTIPALGATSVCLRAIDAQVIRDLVLSEHITHFCGAPVVLQFLANLPDAESFRFEAPVRASTGGAPPSPTLLEAMRRMNVEVTHLYGMTETHGPFTYAAVQDEWRALPGDEFAKKIARQGVANFLGGEVAVLDDDYRQVPGDGSTMGEIGFRGNAVMKGYYREPEITEKAFAGGWFRSGDLGVLHDDGYIELRDRAKDIIISGGENISSIEVENTLASHPDIEEAAIVSMPNERWGEVPAAFVSPKSGKTLTEQEVIDFCRDRLAHYKCPQQVIFETLPRTSTGKVQKYSLRERMWEGHDTRIKG